MRPPRTVREDVHIHAPAGAVYALVAAAEPQWLPPAFAAFEATDGRLAFTLALPLRNEHARLVRASAEAPRLLEFAADGPAAHRDGESAVMALTWVLNDEAPHEVHVAAELAYLPAAGALGWALEETVQRPARRQALRDALWRLKRLAEGER